MTSQVQVCVVTYMILVYLENGRLEMTVCLHQILCYTEQNSTETFKTLKVAFGEQTVGRTQALSGLQSSRAVRLLLKMLNT
jgi:hypothetical protein